MDEQKTEDTKQPLPRRGARPFAGPTSAAGAARPFLRPPSPGQRTGPAPFAPRGVPNRSTLGDGVTPAAVGGLESHSPAMPAEVPAPSAAAAAGAAVDAVVPIESVAPAAPATAQPSVRPATSEMVALDAIDAFDALWAAASDVAGELHATHVDQSAASTPLDESSLGTLDGPSVWSDEIAGPIEQAEPDASSPTSETPPARASATLDMPAWLAEDHAPVSVDPTPEAVEPPIPETVAASGIITDDPPPVREVVASEQVARPELPEREIPIRDQVSASQPAWPGATSPTELDDFAEATITAAVPGHDDGALGADRARFELVEETEPVSMPGAIASAPLAARHGLQVSAALDRLAERIRAGEIDVSSIAPEASDAAVLASVLAALLGGSSSR